MPTTIVNDFHYIGSATGASANVWTDDFANTANAPDGTPVTPTPDCNPLYLDINSAYGSIFTYDESIVTDCYLSGWRVATSSNPASRGKGYAATINTGVVLDETGSYSKTAVDLNNLSITPTNLVTYSKGYHLVSNPFFAPIDWSAMAALAYNNNMDATAYIYSPNSGTYGIYNLINVGYITTNMAFFVRHDPGYSGSTFNVRFDPSTRATLGNNGFLRQQQPYEYALKVTSAIGNYSDQTLIAFDENFSDNYDNGYDAGKLLSSYGVPSLYTRDTVSERLAVQAIGLNEEIKSVPLGIIPGKNGSCTFTFEGIENFPATIIIWLEDLKTGTIQYLRQNNTYTFTTNTNDDADRFVLHFTPELLITTTTANCEGLDGSIRLDQRAGVEWIYELSDDNSVIANDTFTGINMFEQLPAGAYNLELNHPVSGYVTNESITIDAMLPVTAMIDATVTEVKEEEPVILEAQLTGATDYNWDMGDGTTFINQPTVSHAYTTYGTYEVILFAANDDCEAEARQQIIVTEKQDTVSTGIAISNEGSLRVYVHGNILHLSQTMSRKDVEVEYSFYNLVGQKVGGEKIQLGYNLDRKVELNLLPGLYFVDVRKINLQVTTKIALTGNR